MGITDYIRARCDICGKEETFDGCGIQTPRATFHDNKWRTILADSNRTLVICPDCGFSIKFYIDNLRGKVEDDEFEKLGECTIGSLGETTQKILELVPDETKPYCIFIEDSKDPYNCSMLKLENVYWYRKLKKNEKFIPRCGFTGKELVTDSEGRIFKCDGCARGYKG